MFLKANELAQGSKTLGRKTRIFTIDFTFLGHHGKQLLALEAKKKKNTERESTDNTKYKYYTIIY